METQTFPAVRDLDTPPPSPPFKKPKLEPPPTPPTLRTLPHPHSDNEATPQIQTPTPHGLDDARKQCNQDLPDDFLEPLHPNMIQDTTCTFFLQARPAEPAILAPPSLPVAVPTSSLRLSDLQSGSESLVPQLQQSSGAVSPSEVLSQQQVVTSTPELVAALSSSSAALGSEPLHSQVPLTQVRPHLRGLLPPLLSSSPPSQCTNAGLITSSPQRQEVSPNTLPDASRRQRGCRQFWKAGDYEGDRSTAPSKFAPGGMDHVRVHPKFLHSNATSHKWALGAVAELLDNALDEVSNGATFVNVDMLRNPEDGGPMLLFEDDGGGMSPDCLRQCMSLGYSVKSKRANTIGQYGNGFKTSTMRLGSDVLVFTRCPAKSGSSPTQSIGMLSYSFLRDTNQEDIIVPMVDYEVEPCDLRKVVRSTEDDWNRNMATITNWSPYHTEAELLSQFQSMKHQGTKIVIYNLWEDDEGQLELDFEADPYDIQVRGANRDEKKIAMAEQYPNSRHYLTYRHSLRSYASILYLRIPDGFHMILRRKEVEHHPLVNDMMYTQEHSYRPHSGGNAALKEANMMAVVAIGFVKDAKEHIDVQGFNVYHKNRLIKPFWRIWNAASSQGRGIIAVLEANFVEPAHDKQGFERTVVLGRLESRLLQMQKTYWKNFSHKVGYGKRDTPRVHYPARGMIRLEAPLSRVVTRGISSISGELNPETISEFHVMREDCVSNGIKESACTDDSTIINAKGQDGGYTDGASLTCSALTLVQGSDVNVSSPAMNRVAIIRNDAIAERLKLEVVQNEQLELKVMELRKTVVGLKESISEVSRERDRLKSQLNNQVRQQAIAERELRLQLKAACFRIRQLEGEKSGLCTS